MRKFLLIAVLALAAGSVRAQAQSTNPLYVGAGIMNDSVQNLYGSGFNIDNTSFKALAGLRFSLLGAEVDYYHLGSESRRFYFGGANADAYSFAAYAVGYLPLPILDFFGKVGFNRWQLSGSSASPGLFDFSDNGVQLAWGLGAQAHFGNLVGRLEYERLNMSNTDGARIVSLDLIFNIL